MRFPFPKAFFIFGYFWLQIDVEQRSEVRNVSPDKHPNCFWEGERWAGAEKSDISKDFSGCQQKAIQGTSAYSSGALKISPHSSVCSNRLKIFHTSPNAHPPPF